MTADDLVDRLARHKVVGAAPREELEWLAEHGAIRNLAAGEVVTRKGENVLGLFVVLSGYLGLFVDRGAGPQKVSESRAGDVTGLLPYSRLVHVPGDSVAIEASTMLVVLPEHVRAMTRECPVLTEIFVHTMVDRARTFTSNALHDEKMASLGKLSAGLAHELNNPASAIERSAALLESRLEDADRAARALGASNLTAEQLATVEAVCESCAATRAQGVRSPIEEAEREEAIADWLAGHGVDAGLAEALSDTAVTLEGLDRLAAAVNGPALDAALRSAAAGCSVLGLASEIREAAARIAGLVAAIKGFTHMDQATVAEPVDLAQSLGNTVAVLKTKARGKSVAVVVDVEPGLPRVRGFGGELNQIWLNLIDNALDAVEEAGRVEIQARRERERVAVRVADNGSGIPEEIRAKIFEPFFTTKPMGEGTGLGLDIVRRLVTHNDGQISVESRPGRTEFLVTLLPAEGAAAAPA
jgi:signal transduction histidine kinase